MRRLLGPVSNRPQVNARPLKAPLTTTSTGLSGSVLTGPTALGLGSPTVNNADFTLTSASRWTTKHTAFYIITYRLVVPVLGTAQDAAWALYKNGVTTHTVNGYNYGPRSSSVGNQAGCGYFAGILNQDDYVELIGVGNGAATWTITSGEINIYRTPVSAYL